MEKQTNVYQNTHTPPERYFSAKEYALLHKVNQKTVYDWIKTDKLPVHVHVCQFTNREYMLIDPYYPAPKSYRKPKNQVL